MVLDDFLAVGAGVGLADALRRAREGGFATSADAGSGSTVPPRLRFPGRTSAEVDSAATLGAREERLGGIAGSFSPFVDQEVDK